MPPQSIVIPTVQLYVGSLEHTSKKTCTYLQSVFCLKNGCTTCIHCIQIVEKKHESCLWLTPKKQYLLDDLAPMQNILRFSRSQGERFFFIIEAAAALSLTSSNMLLKCLEEPPAGYHFILLAKETTELLPTILSRCVVFYTQTNHPKPQFKALYDHFTHTMITPSLFIQELERSKITEDESEELFRQIIQFWQNQYESTCLTSPASHNNVAEKRLALLYNASELLPTVGNAKLFWKKLLLQFALTVDIN